MALSVNLLDAFIGLVFLWFWSRGGFWFAVSVMFGFSLFSVFVLDSPYKE